MEAKFLKFFLEGIDNVRLVVDDNQEEPFQVDLGKHETKEVCAGKLKVTRLPDKTYLINQEGNIKIEKPSQEIVITINSNKFGFKDIPSLVLTIQNQHNQLVKEKYKFDNKRETNTSQKSLGLHQRLWKLLNTEVSDLFQNRTPSATTDQLALWEINPALTIARRYIAVIQILEEAFSQKSNEQNNNEKTQEKKSLLETNRTELEKLKTFLEQIVKEYDITPSSETKVTTHKNEERILNTITKDRRPQDISKLLGKLMPIIAKNLVKADEEAMLTTLFERSGAEMLRLTGMDELLEQFENEQGEKIKIEYFQKQLREAKSPQEKAKIQTEIARFFNGFIYKQEYFPPNEVYDKPNQIATERYIQCMTRAFMQYILWHKYFDSEIIGCNTTGHFFAILPLADGTNLSLDFIPTVLTNRQNSNNPLTKLKPYHPVGTTNYNDGEVFTTGNLPRMYMADYYNNKGIKESDPRLSEELFLKAIELNPNNFNAYNSLANLYQENPETFVGDSGFRTEGAVFKEAARLYKKTIELNPNGWSAYNNLALLYKKNPQVFAGDSHFDTIEAVFKEAERLYKKTIELNPNGWSAYNNLALLYQENPQTFIADLGFDNEEAVFKEAERLYLQAIKFAGTYEFFVTLCLADLYHKSMNKPNDALPIYKEILDTLDQNPNTLLWMTKEELKKVINDLDNNSNDS